MLSLIFIPPRAKSLLLAGFDDLLGGGGTVGGHGRNLHHLALVGDAQLLAQLRLDAGEGLLVVFEVLAHVFAALADAFAAVAVPRA